MARSNAARVRRSDDVPGGPPPGPAAVPGEVSEAAPGAGPGAARASALDRVIHERLRLGIVSALAVNRALTFTDLRALLGATDGNLSVHARKLEDAGYVRVEKSFDGRIPRTEYTLTAEGRAALARYLDHMEALIRATRAG